MSSLPCVRICGLVGGDLWPLRLFFNFRQQTAAGWGCSHLLQCGPISEAQPGMARKQANKTLLISVIFNGLFPNEMQLFHQNAKSTYSVTHK